MLANRVDPFSCLGGVGWLRAEIMEIDDPRLTELVDPEAAVELLATGCVWTEGPVYLPGEDAVLFSDIPNNRICRWSASDGFSVWRGDAEYTNGHTLDPEGRLLSCSHGLRRLERTEHDGSVTELVGSYQGRRLNSPNDLVVAADGAIWFTDPPYGILSDWEGHAADSEIGDHYVYRFDPATGALVAVTDVVVDPNGLAFSPDESRLYVSDTSRARHSDGNHHIMAFDVIAGLALADPRVFAVIEPGLADGFKVTSSGWVLTSAADGIHVYDADGVRLGRIPIPEVVSNCCFGGPDGHTLFITATTSLYQVKLNAV